MLATEYQAVLNGHATGIIMKELVRRAIVIIRNERQVFEVQSKPGYGSKATDFFTSADSKAQASYRKSLTECFPDFGIVAEEDNLRIDPKGGCEAYFTVDPLDGTSAYIRRQSHGVGTMISLVERGRVVAAYVGDANTQEIYGFRPGSEKVHRISQFEAAEELGEVVGAKMQMKTGYALLRDPESFYGELSRESLGKHFKNYIVDGGSIGVWLARLWKGEVEGALLPPGVETPWDASPVVGISLALGFAFLRPDPSGKGWKRYDPTISTEVVRRNHDTLILHENYLSLL